MSTDTPVYFWVFYFVYLTYLFPYWYHIAIIIIVSFHYALFFRITLDIIVTHLFSYTKFKFYTVVEKDYIWELCYILNLIWGELTFLIMDFPM